MVIEWRERQHEVDDNDAFQDPNTVRALHEYDLLNCFHIPTMKM